MKLHQALEVQPNDIIALTGAGGKSSALVALGRELMKEGHRVLATTTTRIGTQQLELFPAHLPVETPASGINYLLKSTRLVFLTSEIGTEKTRGATPEQITALSQSLDYDVLLIEADGSRRLPLKVPLPHEPVIPTETTLVVHVIGLSVIGHLLDDAHVYNASAISQRYDVAIGQPVQPELITKILQDRPLMTQHVPNHARIAVLLNQVVPDSQLHDQAVMIAEVAMQFGHIERVLIGAVQRPDPIHAVVRPEAQHPKA